MGGPTLYEAILSATRRPLPLATIPPESLTGFKRCTLEVRRTPIDWESRSGG
jgi:hypothetical protein